MERILITYGTRPFSQRVARLLAYPERTVFGSCEAVPQVMLDSGKYVRIPQGSSAAFSHEMLKHCLDIGAGLLIPLGKAELRPLAEAKQLFAEYGIHVLVPDPFILEGALRLENPTSQIQVDVVLDGVSLLGDGEDVYHELSGVIAPRASDGNPPLCCIRD